MLQRTCACGQHTIAGGECAECRNKRLSLQRRAINQAEPTTVPPIVHEVLHSPGQPLDAAKRAFMEPRFGHDFSRIPIHPPAVSAIQTKLAINKPGDEYEQETDGMVEPGTYMPGKMTPGISKDSPMIQRKAIGTGERRFKIPPRIFEAVKKKLGKGRPLEASVRLQMEALLGGNFSQVNIHIDIESQILAKALNAKAFRVNQDVFFAAGTYDPDSIEGRKLLAHELTHILRGERIGISEFGLLSEVPVEPIEEKVAEIAEEKVDEADRQSPEAVEFGEEKRTSDESTASVEIREAEPIKEKALLAPSLEEKLQPQKDSGEQLKEKPKADDTEVSKEKDVIEAPAKSSLQESKSEPAGLQELPDFVAKKFAALDESMNDRGSDQFQAAQGRITELGKNERHLRQDESPEGKLKQIKDAVKPPEQGDILKLRDPKKIPDAVRIIQSLKAKEKEPDQVLKPDKIKDNLKLELPNVPVYLFKTLLQPQKHQLERRINENIGEQVKPIEENYKAVLDKTAKHDFETIEIPEPAKAPATNPLKLGENLISPLSEEATDFTHAVNELDEKQREEGISDELIAEAEDGPFKEYRENREKISEVVKEGIEIVKDDKNEHQKLQKDLQSDEKLFRKRMVDGRETSLKEVHKKQRQAQNKEEKDIEKTTVVEIQQKIFDETKQRIEPQIKDLVENSVKQFDGKVKEAETAFDNNIKKSEEEIAEVNAPNFFRPLTPRQIRIFIDNDTSSATPLQKRYLKVYEETSSDTSYQFVGGLFGGRSAWDKAYEKVMLEEVYPAEKAKLLEAMNASITKIISEAREKLNNCINSINKADTDIESAIKKLGPKISKTEVEELKAIRAEYKKLRNKISETEHELNDQLTLKREKVLQRTEEKIKKFKEQFEPWYVKAWNGLKSLARRAFEWIFEQLGETGRKVLNFLKEVASVFIEIVKHPIRFVENLVEAGIGGFKKFAANFEKNIKEVFMNWLFGNLEGTEISIPEVFTPASIFGVILDILHINVDYVRTKAAEKLGAEKVEFIERVIGFIRTLFVEGPLKIWEEMREFAENIKDDLMTSVQNWLITEIVEKAIEKVIKIFIPGGGFVAAAEAIYKIIKWIINNIEKIVKLFEAIISSISDIAKGDVSKAIDWIEKAMVGILSQIVSFLAGYVGLDNIGATIRKFVDNIRHRVDDAIDKMITKIATRFGKGKTLGKAEEKEGMDETAKDPKQKETQPDITLAKQTVKHALDSQLPEGARQLADVEKVLTSVATEVKPALTDLRAEEFMPDKPKEEGTTGFTVRAKLQTGKDSIIDKVRFSQKGKVLSHEERWQVGVKGVKRALKQLEKRGISEETIKAQFPRWQSEFGFSALILDTKQTPWVIEGEMSPIKVVTEVPDYTSDVEQESNSATEQDVLTEAEALENELTILSEPQAVRGLGISMERHHSFFSFLLRAFKKAKQIKKVPRHPRLEQLGPDEHQELIHQLWDSLHPNLGRGEGASNRIAEMIRKGKITPKGIANVLVAFYNKLLKTAKNEEEREAFKRIIEVVRKIRKEMKI